MNIPAPLLLLFLPLLLIACKAEVHLEHLQGQTMGTYYNIKYIGETEKNLQGSIDSLLQVINMSMSTYIDSSLISGFNKDTVPVIVDEHFKAVFLNAKKVHKATNGAFDPTVMPLVNGWGFGFKNRENMDSARVDSLLALIGFDEVVLENNTVRKLRPGIMLDFSAIAKGYGVDAVANLIERRGIKDFAVDIGGEVVVRGKNAEGKDWLFAIAKPEDDPGPAMEIHEKVRLKNEALATSGNYKNFYIENGEKYSHTISPFTGYPVKHNLLSASVFAEDCATADAFATAFMVLGKEESIKVAQNNRNIKIFLIYDDEGNLHGYKSEGLEKKFTKK